MTDVNGSFYVHLLPCQIFACQMAEVISLQPKDEVKLKRFLTLFEEKLGFKPKPEMYDCQSFDEVLHLSAEFMKVLQ